MSIRIIEDRIGTEDMRESASELRIENGALRVSVSKLKAVNERLRAKNKSLQDSITKLQEEFKRLCEYLPELKQKEILLRFLYFPLWMGLSAILLFCVALLVLFDAWILSLGFGFLSFVSIYMAKRSFGYLKNIRRELSLSQTNFTDLSPASPKPKYEAFNSQEETLVR